MSIDIREKGNFEVTVFLVNNPIGAPTRIFFTEQEAKQQLLDDFLTFQEKSTIDLVPLFITQEALKRLNILMARELEDKKTKKSYKWNLILYFFYDILKLSFKGYKTLFM